MLDTAPAPVKNIGMLMAGGTIGKTRHKDDFYPTPAECTLALARKIKLPKTIWEPACGDGAIAKVLEQRGHTVVATDLNDHGYGIPRRDFLMEYRAEASAIITNPPFKLAEEFIRHAIALDVDLIAMFLKATYWQAATRTKLFKQCPPTQIYALAWRPDFSGEGQPTMECAWHVWRRKSRQRGTQYSLLIKPRMESA